jgi:hypothetical protein
MKIRALVSFSGALSMSKGEIRECSNKAILHDLLKAGYIEEVTEKQNKDKDLQDENEKLRKELAELKKALKGKGNKDTKPPKDVKPDESK